MEQTGQRPPGGAFMQKSTRNENLRRYHARYPRMTHADLARVFKISRVRVTQILNNQMSLEEVSPNETH